MSRSQSSPHAQRTSEPHERTVHEPASNTSGRLTKSRFPFARFERSFSKLFRTYCTDYNALDGHYAGNPWSIDARADAARRAAEAERPDRQAVAGVLAEQNADLSGEPNEAIQAHLDALRDPEGVAVVTGQQVGLFTGPLYTIYKTLTTLRLAERLREETGRPVAPVFWLPGEDHDFDEVAAAHLLCRNDLTEIRLPTPEREGARNSGPVGRLVFDDGLAAALDRLDEVLPASDFKPRLMEAARDAYAPGAALLPAFARLLRALLPEDAGLVFIDPSDPRLKAHAAPLIRREIEAPRAAAEQVSEAGRRLEAQGGHAQVTARPANLFLLEEEGRLPLDLSSGEAGEDVFSVRGTGRYFSKKELLALLDEAPERFSPNVVLRPLVQDRLLPTAAYVGGPGEVAYFGQLRGVYEHFGVEMPLAYPRASVTLLERKVVKVLDKFALDPPDLEGDVERLFQQIVEREMDADLDGMFGKAQPPIHEALNDLKPQVEAVDRTLGASVEAARAEIAGTLDDLKSKALRAEKRDHDEVRAQLQKARANLFPGGAPQERVINVLYFLNKYGGPALLENLYATLSLDTREHQAAAL